MAMKRSIAKLVRKKLFNITNTKIQRKLHNQEEKCADERCIEELLKEKAALMQVLAERDKIIELTGAELLRLLDNVEKLQRQNWNLAQSNSQMLAELNLGKERVSQQLLASSTSLEAKAMMKALQHEILCKAALLQGKNSEVREIEDMDCENDGSLLKERAEKAEQPLMKTCKFEKPTKRSPSTGSVTASRKDANERKEKKEIRLWSQPRRRSGGFKAQECKPMKMSSETEDVQSHLSILNSPGTEDETFGKPLRKTVEKVQPYKEVPPKVKLRRLE